MINQTASQYLWRYLQQKVPRYKTQGHQNKMAIYLVSMFTDAHLRNAAFELLKSVDT